jgi:Zn-dependent protease with chaperone function
MRILLKLALAAVAVTALVAAAQRPSPPPEKTADERFTVKITEEMKEHSRIRDTLYFAGTAWSLGVLGLLQFTSASRRMRDASQRISKRPFVASMIFVALLIVTITLLELPLTFYSDYVIPHRFALSDQSLGSWTLDGLKEVGVGLAIGSTVGALALLAVRKVRRWWLVLWAASIPFTLAVAVVQPIILDPLFNKFEPLQNVALRQKLLDLASRAGIEGSRVYQVDKSKQTKTMNAYVNGIGPTNRIVLWDTLLAKLTDDEILAVMGHEMGHYVLNHIWKGLVVSLASSFFVFFLVQAIYDHMLQHRPEQRGDLATVPLLLLIASILGFLATPVVAWRSRAIEHEADVFSLELTHLNEPMATAFVKMSEDSKRDPSPPAFIEYWRYSHPPIAKRIPFALGYKPWERGEANQVWKP